VLQSEKGARVGYPGAAMPFYGIGSNTSRDNIVNFSEQDISAGASVLNPINSWLDVSGGVEYLKRK
jgi:hypothetical protein